MRADLLEQFIDDVFHNILDLRECNRRLLEHLYVRQREQAPVIQKIGDVFLNAAVEFRLAYPNYIGHLPVSEKRMKEEAEGNAEFRRFLEVGFRLLASSLRDRKSHRFTVDLAMRSSRRCAPHGLEALPHAPI